MDYMSVQELAELKGCSERYIRAMITKGKLSATLDNKGKQYRIAVSALTPDLQKRYYGKITSDLVPLVPNTAIQRRSLESFTDAQRKEIADCYTLVEEWQTFRNNPQVKQKTELDKQFVLLKKLQGVDISEGSLYRLWKAVKEGDLNALVDNRGKWRKGQSSIDDHLFNVFLYNYLDERKLALQKCYSLTQDWAREYQPHLMADMPSYSAFYRRVNNDVAEYVLVMRREGNKAYSDRYAPYIDRLYDDLASNEYWIGDNHTLDILSRPTVNSPTHRLHVTAFIDALSGMFTGINVTNNPCSGSTLLALRDGIIRCGAPHNNYLDNGSEFLTHDIGGRGHRTKRKYKDEKQPDTIFTLLGIHMINAEVRNAKAKPIERTFGTLKGHFSKMWDTYCGGNVLERPEKLKQVLKQDRIPLDEEIIAAIKEFCFEYFNHQPYTGKVKRFRGMTRMEVFQQHLVLQRRATMEDLNLLLMRHSRFQKVSRIGVHIEVAGQRLDYWNSELLELQSKDPDKRVSVRYDPADLDNVYVYDIDGAYMMTVPMNAETRTRFGANTEEVKTAKRCINATNKYLKNKAKQVGQVDEETKITLYSLLALQNVSKGVDEPILGKTVLPIRPKEDSIPHKPTKAETNYRELISEERMNRNAQKMKGAV